MTELLGSIGALLMIALIALLAGRFLRELGAPIDTARALRVGLGSAVASAVWVLLIGCFLTWQVTGRFTDPTDVPLLWKHLSLPAAGWPFTWYISLALGAGGMLLADAALRRVLDPPGADLVLTLMMCTPLGLYAFLPTPYCAAWVAAGAVLYLLSRRCEPRSARLPKLPEAPVCALLLILTTALALTRA